MKQGKSNSRRLRNKNKKLKERVKALGGTTTTFMPVPEDIENEFLKCILGFDGHSRGKRIKIRDRLGKDFQVKPVNEIGDDEILECWFALHKRMSERGIDLTACSPNVTARELYRFSVEELFEVEIDDIDVPGLMNCFFYDEFHPDYKYDNGRVAVDDCINSILSKKGIFDCYQFADTLRFNTYRSLPKKKFFEAVTAFQNQFDEINDVEIRIEQSELTGSECKISGFYKAKFNTKDNSEHRSGVWQVDFSQDETTKYWYINQIEMEGIELLIRSNESAHENESGLMKIPHL